MPPVDVGKVLLEPAILALLGSQQPSSQASFITNGLSFTNVGGLVFRVSAGTVSINNVAYSFAQTDVTLTAANGSNPRIDLIVADSGTGTIHKIDGTAAANPVRPDYDPLTQFQITFILVPTGATSIPTISQAALYHEATETTVTTANGRIVGNSTNNPLAGTKDIEATAAVADDWVLLTNASPITISNYNQLVLNIRSKATWPVQKNLQFTWFSGATKVAQIVSLASGSLGFNSAITNAYQQVIIPLANFGSFSGTVTALEIRVKGASSSIGFYLDDIYLENSGLSTPSSVPKATSTTTGTVKTTIDVVDPRVYDTIAADATFAPFGIPFQFGDAVAPASAGQKIYAIAPFDGSFVDWSILLNVSGSATFTVKRASGLAGSLTSVGGTIPSITSAATATGNATSWTNKTFAKGDPIEVTLVTVTTATIVVLSINGLRTNVSNLVNILSSSLALPYTYPYKEAIDDPINDNFAGVGIDTAGSRRTGATAWTARNIGSSVVTVDGKRLWLQCPAEAALNIRGYGQPVPSGNWCIRAHVNIRPSQNFDTGQKMAGLYLRDSGGKYETFAVGLTGGASVLWAAKWTSASAFSASRTFPSLSGTLPITFLEIEFDGTNYHLRCGNTDAPLAKLTSAFQFAATNFLAAAATEIGVFAANDSNVATTLVCPMFYRVPVSAVL